MESHSVRSQRRTGNLSIHTNWLSVDPACCFSLIAGFLPKISQFLPIIRRYTAGAPCYGHVHRKRERDDGG